MQGIAIFMGVVTGAVHVLAGPDHLAALAPLAVGQERRCWLAGTIWGIGHASGVILVAAIAWVIRGVIPIESISAWGERLVGVMLLFIGFWGVRKALALDRGHEHARDGHTHGPEAPPHTHRRTGGSLLVGILHGSAGSSHFFGVLPALALPTRAAAAAYLLAFGAGTIFAMASFTSACGLLGNRMRGSGIRWYRNLIMTCAMASFIVGGFWLVG